MHTLNPKSLSTTTYFHSFNNSLFAMNIFFFTMVHLLCISVRYACEFDKIKHKEKFILVAADIIVTFFA